MSGNTRAAWVVAQLKPNSDRIAQCNLSRQRFEVFQPRIEVTRRQRDRFKRQNEPLFPGYIFVRVLVGDGLAWRALRGTRGISRIVAFGGAPAVVPDDFVSEIRSQCDDDSLLHPDPALGVGDTVRAARGPFVDLVGRIEKLGAEERVWVLLEVMGRQARVEIPRANLERI